MRVVVASPLIVPTGPRTSWAIVAAISARPSITSAARSVARRIREPSTVRLTNTKATSDNAQRLRPSSLQSDPTRSTSTVSALSTRSEPSPSTRSDAPAPTIHSKRPPRLAVRIATTAPAAVRAAIATGASGPNPPLRLVEQHVDREHEDERRVRGHADGRGQHDDPRRHRRAAATVVERHDDEQVPGEGEQPAQRQVAETAGQIRAEPR